MFLISRTFSRQHPFPLLGVRPAIASMDPSVVPATMVQTLFKECPAGSTNRLDYALADGEQGWYKITTSAEPWQQGVSAQTGGVGGAKEYITYLCPGTEFTMWNSYKGGANTLDTNGTACWGGTGTYTSGIKQGGAGAGSGWGSSSTTGSTSISGGAGFVAYLARNQEPTYSAGTPIEIKTMQGYSNNPSLVYLQTDGNPITLTRTPASDSDNGYAWTGFIPDPASSTGGTLAVTGFTPKHIASVGMQIVVYLTSDQVNPIQTTTVDEVTKTTYFMQETNPNNILQGYPVMSTTCVEVGKAGAVTTAFGVKCFVFNGATYYYDEDAQASYSQQVYYAWRVPIHPLTGVTPGDMTRILYTNSSVTGTFGANGVFAYELVRGKMCVCGKVNISTGYAQERVPELDKTGARVVLAVTGANPSIWRKQNYTHTMTGCYFRLLAGGGGNMSNYTANAMRGGCALGTPLKGTGEFFQNQDTWVCKEGPGGAFGATHAQSGAWCVVDGNDTVALHGEGGGSATVGSSTTKIYKLTDSTDVTKYAQKIYFPPSDQQYTVAFTLNGVAVPDTWVIKASHRTTEMFFQDIKQGDILVMEMRGDNGSITINTYTISTETIAFGLWPDSAPWKVREYTSTTDRQLGFVPGYTYGAALISGGGAGGGSNGVININYYGGAGGCSDLRKIIFTAPEHCVGRIHVGKGGVKSTNAGAGGASSGGGASRPGCAGGAAGEPTIIAFDKDVNVVSMKVRLYSWTNGSTVMYTRNSLPDSVGKLTKFCDENGVLNGKTGYKSSTIPNPQELTCQQDGLVYTNVYYSGNPNIDTTISGLVPCIFNDATGGGGGSGGTYQGQRNGVGAGGGGGGAWYRVDLENKSYYLVAGGDGGAGGAAAVGSPGAGAYNGIDGYGITAYAGEPSHARAGGAGGYGYGAGGGGGGGGRNESGSYCGAGGGGAPGAAGARFGSTNAGTNLDFHEPLFKTDDEGRPLKYGIGGYGFKGTTEPDAYYNGTDGYAFIYRFENVTDTTDCGSVEDSSDETIDCGRLTDALITETIDCDLI